MRSALLASTAAAAALASPADVPADCFAHGGKKYALDTVMNGSTFFDAFDFATGLGATHGAEQYLSQADAEKELLVQAHDTHAIVGIGGKGWLYKRHSVKLSTKKNWKYFLSAMKFTKTPYGCSIWPGFWTKAITGTWPDGGELDILEYANDIAVASSLHVGHNDSCKLSAKLLNKTGCPQFPDRDGMNYECTTDYNLHRLGCAPSTFQGFKAGIQWSTPGTIAVEWTAEYAKVFYFPGAEAPADLENDTPNPDTWDQYVVSYYPFAASEADTPGSCAKPGEVMTDQQLVLNMAMCGDWAGGVWTANCAAQTSNCKTNIWDPPIDCCTQFIWNSANDDYFKEHGYFNISWMKVFQAADKTVAEDAPLGVATSTSPRSRTSALSSVTSFV